MNSKQIVAVVSVIALLVILVYPALATGTVAISIRAEKIEKAEHVYVTIGNIRAHRSTQASSEGWEQVYNQSQTIDLVSLENTSMIFGKGKVSLGVYDAIRLEISNVTWTFNKTSTNLNVESSELQASIEFTSQAGRELPVMLMLTGHLEESGSTKLFVSSLSATVTGSQ